MRRLLAGLSVIAVCTWIGGHNVANAQTDPCVDGCVSRATYVDMRDSRNAWRAKYRRLVSKLRWNVVASIRVVFERHAGSALAVAYCESRYSIRAQNGQYLGVFQMGSSERRDYARGLDYSTAIGQVKAGYRMWRASGKSWHRWECQP